MSPSDPRAWVVHKFGGSSVADAACFERVAAILESQPRERLAVVLSACKGVTDALLDLVKQAEQQSAVWEANLSAVRARHAQIAETLDASIPQVKTWIFRARRQLAEMLKDYAGPASE